MQGPVRAPTSGGPYEEGAKSIHATLRARLLPPPSSPLPRADNGRQRAAALLLRLPGAKPCCPRAPGVAGGGEAHAPRRIEVQKTRFSPGTTLEAALRTCLLIPTYCPASLVGTVPGREKPELDPGTVSRFTVPGKAEAGISGSQGLTVSHTPRRHQHSYRSKLPLAVEATPQPAHSLSS